MRTYVAVGLCLLISVFCLSGLLQAQRSDRGIISGVVTDPTGAVVADAPVKALHVDTGTTMTGTTSQTGLYTIPQLPVGRYEVTVAQPGFKTFRREGLTLSATQILRLDVTLEVGRPQNPSR